MWRALPLVFCVGVALAAQQPNTLTSADTAAGWRLLFDGKTTAGWHPYGKLSAGAPTKAHGWDVVDGTLVALGKGTTSTDDIVTDEDFTNFELDLEWKVAPQPGGDQGADALHAGGLDVGVDRHGQQERL